LAKVNLFPDPSEVLRLTTLVLADFNPTGRADAAYLFGHTPDNEVSILNKGAELWSSEQTDQIVLCGGGSYLAPNRPDAKCAYSGAPAWRGWLVKNGVLGSDIAELPRPDLSHTGTEAVAFAKYAKKQNWTTVYIVAWPAHMLRAFANMVAAVNRFYPELLVYCKAGTPLAWGESAVSSQGTVGGARFTTVMDSEWERLNVIYGNEFDLAGANEIHDYVLRREGLARVSA